jgi:hypothetical protein
MLSNEQIRANLIANGKLFLERNCQYNDQENEPVKTMLQYILEPIGEYEEYNEKHPDHGKREVSY